MVQLVVQLLKVATIAVMSVLVVFGGSRFFDYFQEQNAVAGMGKPVTFVVKDDDTIDTVAQRLHDRGLIRFEYYFKGLMQVSRKDFVSKSYKLRTGMTTTEIVDAITTGSVKKPASNGTSDQPQIVQLTVVEGWRTEQIADELDKLKYKPGGKAFLDAVKNYPSDRYDFLKDRPDPKSLEGYLYPDTYDIDLNEAPESIIQKMLDNLDSKFAKDMRTRASEMGLSFNEVLMFASIVEREVAYAPERPIVADLYLKRYQNGWRLESDPGIQYALGKEGDWWPKLNGDTDLFFDSPYNTYQNDGLLPGPICNPRIESIQSVLTPTPTPYYYMYADEKTGKHLFAASKAEQEQNAAFVQDGTGEPAFGSDPFGPDSPVGGASTDNSGSTDGQPVDNFGATDGQPVDNSGDAGTGDAPVDNSGDTGGENVPIEQTDGQSG